ncbi:copper homeostasis protein [Hydrogenoanaerobacterium saccharovorans]|uniref:PF03932 family protein CutC n=1 Tax=Hydrogenoanaerobacterium saccharovorans TaxID=474960 RepID=A0A1H8AIH7_9FIRM|nr:copper homeostasis protein CutC [Hydrogenoanaerobacterium saccharovorans]RPF47967.1 copper homeostasis protein [Hydrogenoanaerobacterium saccharovorans]SEM69638.1 copper homeostasis protein [Hydrogenoanaerobacterium saccharovorans]
MINNISVEICCGSLEDCLAAQSAGADCIELVTAHLLGGLTPSAGLLYKVKEKVRLPVSAIVRPRAAGFCYSDEDFEVMCRDAKEFARIGADGIVFGFLQPNGNLDYERCARFLDCVGDCTPVFHRAIDVVEDMLATAERLIGLGVKRILTSGGKENALAGAPTIRKLVQQCGDRIQILAGGGIRANNIAQVIAQTGVKMVHFSGTAYREDTSTCRNPNLNFGASVLPPNENFIVVNKNNISDIMTNI